MSRTDVHRPWWVLERDPHMRRDFKPDHNHWILTDWDPELGTWRTRLSAPCDLGQGRLGPGPRDTRCTFYPSGRRRFCSCGLCGQQAARRYSHRQERTWWRSIRAQLLATAADGCTDADVPPFRREV